MHFNKMISLGGFSVLVGLCALSGCNQAPGDGDGEGDGTSSVKMAFTSDVSWEGNSVRIIGVRDGKADSKYRCNNAAEACFNFNADGTIEPATGQNKEAKAFEELCASNDVNDPAYPGSGKWSFYYEVFAGEDCYGTPITTPDNAHDFVCVEPSDVLMQSYPNATVNEFLPSGEVVVNKVICLSENVEKDFEFFSCAEVNPPEGSYATHAFACGCEPDAYYTGCDCGFNPADIHPSCVADPGNYCDILCTVP